MRVLSFILSAAIIFGGSLFAVGAFAEGGQESACPEIIVCTEGGCTKQPNCEAFEATSVRTIARGGVPPPLSSSEQRMRAGVAQQLYLAANPSPRSRQSSVFGGFADPSTIPCAGATVNGVCYDSAVRPNGSSSGNGIPMYRADECIGAIVNGVCHGSVLPKTAVPKRCYGAVVNGQCTGPSF